MYYQHLFSINHIVIERKKKNLVPTCISKFCFELLGMLVLCPFRLAAKEIHPALFSFFKHLDFDFLGASTLDSCVFKKNHNTHVIVNCQMHVSILPCISSTRTLTPMARIHNHNPSELKVLKLYQYDLDNLNKVVHHDFVWV